MQTKDMSRKLLLACLNGNQIWCVELKIKQISTTFPQLDSGNRIVVKWLYSTLLVENFSKANGYKFLHL